MSTPTTVDTAVKQPETLKGASTPHAPEPAPNKANDEVTDNVQEDKKLKDTKEPAQDVMDEEFDDSEPDEDDAPKFPYAPRAPPTKPVVGIKKPPPPPYGGR